jgi:arylsulfate sulfotransferase
MKKSFSLIIPVLVLFVLLAVPRAKSLGSGGITVTGQTAGPTPFIAFITLSASQPNTVKSIRFTIVPKPGSVTRPLSATYSKSYLQSRGDFDSSTGQINLPVFGLYSGYTNTVQLRYLFTDGSSQQDSVSVTAVAFADSCPYDARTTVQARTNTKDLSFDYMLLRDACSNNSPTIMDTDGNRRWVGTAAVTSYTGGFFYNGVFVGSQTSPNLYRIEMDGTFAPVGDFTGTDIHNFHHNIDLGKHGGLLVEADTQTQVESTILEVNAVTGAILKRWNMADIISAAMTAGGDDPTQFVYPSPTDWFHNNTTTYKKSDDSLIVSSRENFVIALDYESGAIKWILGDPTKKWHQFPSLAAYALNVPSNSLPPIGEHALSITKDDNLLMFDNGRNSIFQNPMGLNRGYSSPRKYNIDLTNNTATELWNYPNSQSIFSQFCSSVYEDASANYLVDYALFGNPTNTKLLALTSAGAKVFDYQWPTTNCNTDFNALPIHLERLVYTTPTDVPSRPRDLNGDGIDDILWQNNATNEVNAWLMNGSGSPSSTLPLKPQNTDAWKVICMGDINDDGVPDLVWQNGQTNAVMAWLLDNAGHSAGSVTLKGANSESWRLITMGDINNDGVSDLIWQDASSHAVAVWLMDGAGHRNSSLLLKGANNDGWVVAEIADINHDGVLDVVWENTSSHAVAAWFMDGNGHRTGSFLIRGAKTTDWRIVGAADINHDGIDDLLIQNAQNQAVAAWIMDGAGSTNNSIFLRTLPEGDGWRVNGRVLTSPAASQAKSSQTKSKVRVTTMP